MRPFVLKQSSSTQKWCCSFCNILKETKGKKILSVNFLPLSAVQMYMAIRTSGTERVPSKAGDQLTATICKMQKFEEKWNYFRAKIWVGTYELSCLEIIAHMLVLDVLYSLGVQTFPIISINLTISERVMSMLEMKCSLCHEQGTMKPSESRTGFEQMNSQIPIERSNQWSTRETRGELRHLLGSYVTHVLHIAGISNVDNVQFSVEINKERW